MPGETATNAFSCGTSGGGSTPVTGTGTLTYTDACTTDATQAFSYTLFSDVVTLFLGVMANCTADSTNFLTAAGALPAAIRPSATLLIPSVEGTNNGSAIGICYVLLADGTDHQGPEVAALLDLALAEGERVDSQDAPAGVELGLDLRHGRGPAAVGDHQDRSLRLTPG